MKTKFSIAFFALPFAFLLGAGVFVRVHSATAASDQPVQEAPAHAFVISDIGTALSDAKSVLIRWTTDVLADSRVEYGLDESYASHSDPDLTRVFSHAVALTGLKPNSIYFYHVVSTDALGNHLTSPRFVFATPAAGVTSVPASKTPPVLTFSAPRDHEILNDQTVTFTYQINGDWPASDRIPHIYLWTDELRNGTWIERAQAFDIGSRTNAALRSGSFVQKFSPGTYRIGGLLAAYQPGPNDSSVTQAGQDAIIQGSRVMPFVFSVWNASSTDVTASSSSLSPLSLSLPSGPKFKVGNRIRNWRSADVRQTPAKSNSLIGIQTPNTKGTIIGGPEMAGDSRWWNINYDVGYDGWTEQGSLLPVDAPVFDFELMNLDNEDMVVTQGSSANYSFGGRLISGMGQTVVFSLPVRQAMPTGRQAGVEGLPADAYGVFSPSSCTLPCLTTLHISTLRTVPEGVYKITVAATSAKKEKKLSFRTRVTRFAPALSVSLNAPFLDGVVPGSTFIVSSRVSGDTQFFGARSVHFQLDRGKDMVNPSLNGEHMFTSLVSGPHSLFGYLAGLNEVKIKGTDFALVFVSDASLPVVSGADARQVTDTSAVVVWSTDKNSTSRVAYDNVPELRFSTQEFDADSRQQRHTVELQNLIPCTNYVYRAYSKTGKGEGMGLIGRFATTGCLATPLLNIHTESIVSTLSKRTLVLNRADDRLFRVALSPEFADTVAIEMNGLDPRGIESSTPSPTSQSRLVGTHAYRVVALKNPSTSMFSSDKPVTLTMRYLPEDVKDIVPGTLKIWRWTGVEWNETQQCVTDDDAHEISCMTNEISTFALFGVRSRITLTVSSGSLILGAPVAPTLLNTEAPINAQINISTPIDHIPPPAPMKSKNSPATIPTPPHLSQTNTHALTRDLYRGIQDAEVGPLQRFLISRKYLDAGSETGFFDSVTETAVKKFQCDQHIMCEGTPSTTGFGSVEQSTRALINPSLK